MGSITAAFGLKKRKTGETSSTRPFFTNTGFSNISGNSIRLDPSIRRLQDEALGRNTAIYGDIGQATDRFLSNTKSLRDRFLGNQGAFMNARLNPIKQRFSMLRDQTQQGLGQRGLSGSTFMNEALTNVDTTAGRELGDAGALATQEMATFESGLNAQELQAFNQKASMFAELNGVSLEVAKARLIQELETFKLGSQKDSSQTVREKSFDLSGTLGI